MGNYLSGRRRLRLRVEDVPRLDALEWCRANGLPVLSHLTPDGDTYFVGTCPQCKRGVRAVFRVEGRVACRKCAGLIYRSDSESNSEAARVRSDPRATGEALQTLREFLSTGDPAQFNDAMKTLAVAQHISPLDRLPAASDAEAMLTEELLLRILADDLQTATGLIEIIKAQILEGVENMTNRRGESLEVAMRGETLAKLSGAWVTISNVRSNRAQQAAQLLEKRAQTEPKSIGDMLSEKMIREGHICKSGIPYELLNRVVHGGEVTEEEKQTYLMVRDDPPDDEPAIIY